MGSFLGKNPSFSCIYQEIITLIDMVLVREHFYVNLQLGVAEKLAKDRPVTVTDGMLTSTAFQDPTAALSHVLSLQLLIFSVCGWSAVKLIHHDSNSATECLYCANYHPASVTACGVR